MATDDRMGTNGGEKFTGHGAEWKDAGLSADQARTATSWVEQRVDRRSMLTNKDRVEDVRDIMWQLEKDGEIEMTGGGTLAEGGTFRPTEKLLTKEAEKKA